MTPKITTVAQLIESFDDAEPSEQVSVLKRIEIPLKEYEKYITWKNGGYTRNCIVRKDGFEFILICWDAEAGSAIHGHAGQNCWVYQVEGSVLEKRYVQTEQGFNVTNKLSLDAGRISFMHDRMGFHSIENPTKQPSITLHIYANPIDQCNVFNEELDRFELKEMSYDTIDGVEMKPTGS